MISMAYEKLKSGGALAAGVGLIGVGYDLITGGRIWEGIGVGGLGVAVVIVAQNYGIEAAKK